MKYKMNYIALLVSLLLCTLSAKSQQFYDYQKWEPTLYSQAVKTVLVNDSIYTLLHGFDILEGDLISSVQIVQSHINDAVSDIVTITLPFENSKPIGLLPNSGGFFLLSEGIISAGKSRSVITKLSAELQPDSSFGLNGHYTTTIYGSSNTPSGICQLNNFLYLAGTVIDTTELNDPFPFILCINQEGSIHNAFGENGITQLHSIPSPSTVRMQHVAGGEMKGIATNGNHLMAVGKLGDLVTYWNFAVKLNANTGEIMTEFGQDGFLFPAQAPDNFHSIDNIHYWKNNTYVLICSQNETPYTGVFGIIQDENLMISEVKNDSTHMIFTDFTFQDDYAYLIGRGIRKDDYSVNRWSDYIATQAMTFHDNFNNMINADVFQNLIPNWTEDQTQITNGVLTESILILSGKIKSNTFASFQTSLLTDELTILENDLNQNSSIYPNPVRHTLQIESYTDYKLILSDLKGNKLLAQDHISDHQTLDLQHLPQGTYVLHLQNKGTEEKVIQKISVLR